MAYICFHFHFLTLNFSIFFLFPRWFLFPPHYRIGIYLFSLSLSHLMCPLSLFSRWFLFSPWHRNGTHLFSLSLFHIQFVHFPVSSATGMAYICFHFHFLTLNFSIFFLFPRWFLFPPHYRIGIYLFSLSLSHLMCPLSLFPRWFPVSPPPRKGIYLFSLSPFTFLICPLSLFQSGFWFLTGTGMAYIRFHFFT